MEDQIVQAIYGLVALAGITVYSYAGWKASKQPFDAQKFLDSVLTSGTISTIIAVTGLSAMGLSFVGLLTAFLTGAGIDTGLNKTLKAVKPAPPGQPEPVPAAP